MPPKQRSPDDVHDIFNVQVGKPYRGSMVEKIDIETFNLANGKVKVRRLIHCDSGIILIEDTWHEYGDVFVDGKLLPYDQINFPSMDPADFEAPVRKKDNDDDDDEEKKKKRELLRQKAKDMLKKNNNDAPDDTANDELRIKVKTPDGTMIPVVVKKDDTVNDLNGKLEDDHGIPMDEHDLSHNGIPLDKPNATMDDCGINDGDVLNLEPNDELRLKVKTPDGNIIPVVVKKDDTIGDLNNKLEDDHGIPMDEHELSHNGNPLDKPNVSMDDCGINDGDILNLEPKDTTFTVRVRTPDGRKHNVDIKPTDTVMDLKETIENDLDFPIEDQKLSCSGEPLDDPASTMTDNGISNGDVIDLDTGDITVNVRTNDGRRFAIPAKPYSTVKDVKKAIEATQGIPAKDQNLGFEGKPLNDPAATMNDLGVADGDTLDLDSGDKSEPKPRPGNTSGKSSKPKGKDRKRVLNPDSAWVFPTKASAPTEGEIENLQGVWSIPPTKGSGTDPVEVNIHPMNKEPKSDGRTEIHGAYGYINGAKPDADGVVDPANVRFYPPKTKAKDYSPDFEHIGWWSAPESSSKTTVSWRFEGNDCYNVKTHTVNVMGHEMTFVKEWVE